MNTRRVCIDDYQMRAKEYLPRAVYDFIEGGAEREYSLHWNKQQLQSLRFMPHVLQDVCNRDLSTVVFGNTLSAPIALAPTGMNGLIRPAGDLLLARAARRARVPFVLSTASNDSIKDVALVAEDMLWFQLYHLDLELTSKLLRRANEVGCKTLLFTVDTPVNGKRERDVRNRLDFSSKIGGVSRRDAALHPSWFLRQLRAGPLRFANLDDETPARNELCQRLMRREMESPMTWDLLKKLRDQWPHNLVIKGVLRLADAKHCVELGADSVLLSNHGGRQLDCVPTSLQVLPAAHSQLKVPIMVDGGFRRGSDIVKALALGAKLVLLGRALLYGLAENGEDGAFDILELIRSEIDQTLALLGCPKCALLDRSFLADDVTCA